MRKFAAALALAGAMMLAACEGPQPTPPDTHQQGPIDEECPRADHEACR